MAIISKYKSSSYAQKLSSARSNTKKTYFNPSLSQAKRTTASAKTSVKAVAAVKKVTTPTVATSLKTFETSLNTFTANMTQSMTGMSSAQQTQITTAMNTIKDALAEINTAVKTTPVATPEPVSPAPNDPVNENTPPIEGVPVYPADSSDGSMGEALPPTSIVESDHPPDNVMGGESVIAEGANNDNPGDVAGIAYISPSENPLILAQIIANEAA